MVEVPRIVLEQHLQVLQCTLKQCPSVLLSSVPLSRVSVFTHCVSTNNCFLSIERADVTLLSYILMKCHPALCKTGTHADYYCVIKPRMTYALFLAKTFLV